MTKSVILWKAFDFVDLTNDLKFNWPLISFIKPIFNGDIYWISKERENCGKKHCSSALLGCVGLCPPQISISIKILGYEDIEENSGCRYQMEQSWAAKTTLKPSTQDMRKARERGKQKFGVFLDAFQTDLKISVFRMRLSVIKASLLGMVRGWSWWQWQATSEIHPIDRPAPLLLVDAIFLVVFWKHSWIFLCFFNSPNYPPCAVATAVYWSILIWIIKGSRINVSSSGLGSGSGCIKSSSNMAMVMMTLKWKSRWRVKCPSRYVLDTHTHTPLKVATTRAHAFRSKNLVSFWSGKLRASSQFSAAYTHTPKNNSFWPGKLGAAEERTHE